ncbi:hypothetical protein [Spartinivicinus poritis]|uniref:Uncharacterized protein n=1 Tax=Spartinivicinus poritis TaxID=2994640 RepID=A0ABT5UHK9_9GAMM|nr:hypothetical protein [Spartinivicinus sp. A2-2]MDE1465888.1 hypothetical protein [Spartinivicinus sp. A2-2]
MDERIQRAEINLSNTTAPRYLLEISNHFSKIYINLPLNEIAIVDAFINHYENKGLQGLPGRNKASTDVKTNDPQFASKVQAAKQLKLWHYHIARKS